MSLSILLDSQIAKQQNPNKKSHDFTIRFDPPIVLDRNKNYKAALDELVTMSYSWYNVRADYGNNTLRWKKKSDSLWKTITLPDGMFSYDDINSFMQKKLGKVDPSNKESEELFTHFLNLFWIHFLSFHKKNEDENEEDENENEILLLSYSSDWPRENTKLFQFKKSLLEWENENDEFFLRETLLLQKYLMPAGEMDRQWKTLKRKKW